MLDPYAMKNRFARLIRSYQKRTIKFLSIPGMIGYEERLNLYRLVKEAKIDGHLIEFGALLGASTSSILAGLSRSRSVSLDQQLHVVDCFRTPSGSDFADLVSRLANSKSNGHLLKDDGRWMDFKDVFADNINGCASAARMVVHARLLEDFQWTHEAIGFVHLDLPKDWDQLCLVVDKIFSDISLGSLILFQDFVYHWSAELIGFVGILLKQGYIEAVDVVDTTLVVKTKKLFREHDVSKFSILMSDADAVLRGIRDSDELTCHLLNKVQRAVIELSRLQYCYNLDMRELTIREIGEMLVLFSRDSEFSARVGEMLQHNFQLHRSFELGAEQTAEEKESAVHGL